MCRPTIGLLSGTGRLPPGIWGYQTAHFRDPGFGASSSMKCPGRGELAKIVRSARRRFVRAILP